MMTPIFKGRVENGALRLERTQDFRSYLMKLDGAEVEVIVQVPEKTRSISQLRLYWAYLRLIEKETGDSAENLHQIFKEMFKINSTARLNTVEFSQYLDKIVRLMADFDIVLPDAEQFYLTSNLGF
jgi:hypothetical protein